MMLEHAFERWRGPALPRKAGRPLLSWMASATVVASLLAAWAADATPAGFGDLDGAWSGNGTVHFADGTSQRLRCTADYHAGDNGSSLQQSIYCATPNAQFHVNTYIKESEAGLSGNWTETINNLSGRLSGSFAAGKIEVTIAYGGDTAGTMSITISGARQTITIRSSKLNLSQISLLLAKA